MIPWFNFTFNTFGALVAVSIIIGSHLMAKRGKELKLDEDRVFWMMATVLIIGLICSHLLDVAAYQADEPLTFWEVVNVSHGLSSYGGFIGATLGLFIWCAIKKQPRMPYADAVGYGLPCAWMFGRLGCFSVHDHPGHLTSFFLGVQYPSGTRHDLGLYEAIWGFGAMIFFFVLARKNQPIGTYLGWVALLYGPARFALDFLRADDLAHADPRYMLGLTGAQFLSIAATVAGVIILRWTRQHAKDRA